MFDVGFFEIIVFLIICLLIFKPEQLPDIFRSVGKLMRELRAQMHAVTKQLEHDSQKIKNEISDFRPDADETKKSKDNIDE